MKSLESWIVECVAFNRNRPQVDIASRITAADSLDDVLGRLLDFVSGIAKFDACFVDVLEGTELVVNPSRWIHQLVRCCSST
jgi:hypothetical protein